MFPACSTSLRYTSPCYCKSVSLTELERGVSESLYWSHVGTLSCTGVHGSRWAVGSARYCCGHFQSCRGNPCSVSTWESRRQLGEISSLESHPLFDEFLISSPQNSLIMDSLKPLGNWLTLTHMSFVFYIWYRKGKTYMSHLLDWNICLEPLK